LPNFSKKSYDETFYNRVYNVKFIFSNLPLHDGVHLLLYRSAGDMNTSLA